MLIYEFACEAGHYFEGWFDSLEDLRQQLDQGLIGCPACGSHKVRQVPSAFAIPKKAAEVALSDERRAALVTEQALHNFFADHFEDVGTTFFSEALKIHYGAAPARNIRGISSSQEEDVLRQEGVEFFKFSAPEAETRPAPKPRKAGH